MVATASYYRLPPRVLPSIQRVEGAGIGSVSGKTDGTEDLGVMQINTRWIQPLAAFTGCPRHSAGRLINDGCFNIAAAGAILRTYLDEAHGDLMTAWAITIPIRRRCTRRTGSRAAACPGAVRRRRSATAASRAPAVEPYQPDRQREPGPEGQFHAGRARPCNTRRRRRRRGPRGRPAASPDSACQPSQAPPAASNLASPPPRPSRPRSAR